jgi:hypothetical protein
MEEGTLAMNQRTSRPLVGSLLVLSLACGAMATDESPLAGTGNIEFPVVETVEIPNADLSRVLNYVPADPAEGIEGTTGHRLVRRNFAVAAILSRLDIDGDGLPDNAPDTDGDGLPDNWETGGVESSTAGGDTVDRVVFFPAPTAIVPGTPPTPIFTRLAVATSALEADTDGDGISDFVEVFGLMFIDEDRNGLLDSDEWVDKNNDGLPSPGEYPRDNSTNEPGIRNVLGLVHDFDGFVFTDPTRRDTDGDSIFDGADNDPLINPRAFGTASDIIVRFNALGNSDIDKDGLGNGLDMGNDLTSADAPGVRDFQVIDNPESLRDLLALFRQDLLEAGEVPESAIEDLLGADWDGNGLWRTTDIRTWSIVIDEPGAPSTTPPADLFTVDSFRLYAQQTFAELAEVFNDPDYEHYGGRGIGLGWQDLLRPSGGAQPLFVPDDKVWAILYSWRMPGFDVDGDGFVGVPNVSSTFVVRADDGCDKVSAVLRDGELVQLLTENASAPCEGDRARGTDEAFDDLMVVADPAFVGPATEPELDGVIELSPEATEFFARFNPCGRVSGTVLLLMMFSLVALKLRGPR